MKCHRCGEKEAVTKIYRNPALGEMVCMECKAIYEYYKKAQEAKRDKNLNSGGG